MQKHIPDILEQYQSTQFHIPARPINGDRVSPSYAKAKIWVENMFLYFQEPYFPLYRPPEKSKKVELGGNRNHKLKV